jgi:hypothetical protein
LEVLYFRFDSCGASAPNGRHGRTRLASQDSNLG